MGVDSIVTGTITNLGSSVKINSRIISTETGSIFAVASVEILKDATVKYLMGNKAIFISEVPQKKHIDTSLISSTGVSTNGLVLYYPFNNNASDESGHGNNGTVNGAILTTDRFGKTNSAYSFDGSNDYIFIGDALDAFDNDISITAWIKANNYNQFAKIINKGQTKAGTPINSGYSLRFVNLGYPINKSGETELVFSFSDDDSNAIHVSIPISQLPNNNFFLVTGTLKRTSNNVELKLYINAKLISSKTANNIGSSNTNIPLAIGTLYRLNSSGASEFFRGIIDDVQIFNRVLSESEIQAIYQEEI